MSDEPTARAERFDVAIVGGSVAGCTAATLFARRGARVALIESHSKREAYKRTCTHFIQASASPTIERLGLAGPIEAAGAIRNGMEIYSPRGWIRPRPDGSYRLPRYGYNVRRQKLDPLLRQVAAETRGVELKLGVTATRLCEKGGRVVGVATRHADGRAEDIRARLVIGADGRNSRVARWARLRARVRPSERFVYFAYFSDLPLASGANTQFWLLDPDVGYAFPNDDGLTLLACLQTKDKLGDFKRDPERGLHRFFARLPLAPDPGAGTRESPLVGKLDMVNLARPSTGPGLALIGDAALVADPLWGVGIGWAFQSAEWLANEAAAAVLAGTESDIDIALAAYRRRRRRALLGHYLHIVSYTSGRRFLPFERAMMSAAASDPAAALRMHSFLARSAPLGALLGPVAIGVVATSARRAAASAKLPTG